MLGAILLLLLTQTRPALADPKPLTKEEQARIDQAIDKGVAFLKKVQTKQGDFGWKMQEGRFLVGQCALPAYALLEAGVSPDDPVIQKAAAYLRLRVPLADWTYDLALALLFFDRLGDPKDKTLIQMCALRLIAGQHRSGGWAYRCPILNDRNAGGLLKGLQELDKRRNGGERTRTQALQAMEVPFELQVLTVFQDANRLPWQEPPPTPENRTDTGRTVVLEGRTDNSNTQLALLGLWAARRHDVPVDSTLAIAVERFERFHVYPDGYWLYEFDKELSAKSRGTMTCVGLIALAIGRGLRLPTPGSVTKGEKDIHVLRGLAALSHWVGKPKGNMRTPVVLEDLYFLWSLERAAMLFNLTDIDGKDWYRWAAECLVTNQKSGGWWPSPSLSMRTVPKGGDFKATINTSFALLILKHSNPMKDLTPKLPYTARELNEGIARLRPHDKYQLRAITSKPVSSQNKKP